MCVYFFFSVEANNNTTVKQDRAMMLRAAFSQRLETSDGTGFSFDSFDQDVYDETEESDAEELLFELGFGGPSHGVERIPDRFLSTPSMARGVDLVRFFSHQQQLDREIFPPSRRTSGIFTSTTTASHNSSFDQQQQPQVVEEEQQEELEEIIETNERPPSSPTPSEHQTASSSSRKSSLKRQDCFDDLPDVIDPEMHDEAFHEPPDDETDSVVTILKMATETYRVQLEESSPAVGPSDNLSDVNHNDLLSDIKDELRRELSRTDQLLNGLQQRVANQPCDTAAMKTILDDVIFLLKFLFLTIAIIPFSFFYYR